jgi:hypothetical protein
VWESSLGGQIISPKTTGLAQCLELFHVRVNFHFKETQQSGNESSGLLPLGMFSKWFPQFALCYL